MKFFWVALCLSVPVFAIFPARAQTQCYKTFLTMANADHCSNKYYYNALRDEKATHPVANDDRMSCVSGFSGKTKQVIQYIQRKGEYVSLMNHYKPLPGLAADVGTIKADVFIPANYVIWTGGRLALGLRIGDPANPGACNSGGCPISEQNGSSIRLQYGGGDGKGNVKLQLYSYHLNRNTPTVGYDTVWEVDNSHDVAQFGQGAFTDKFVPKGQWVSVVMKVTLNTFNSAGKPLANGSSELQMFNAAGQLVGTAKFVNAVYRSSPKWKIIGPFLNDKTTQHTAPPVTQSTYISDYVISVATNASGCKY